VVPGSAAEVAGALNPQDLIGMPTQAVKTPKTPLKRSKGRHIHIPGVNPLMYLEAVVVDGVHPEGSGAALLVEEGVEPDIHQSTSAKKAVMNTMRKGRSVPVTMKAAVVEAAAEVSAGVTAADSVGATAVAAEAVEVSVEVTAGVTEESLVAEAVGVSAEVTAGVTEESPAGVTVVVAEVVEAADEAVVDQPMAKVAHKNKQGKNKTKSKFQQQISNKERKESRSTLKNI